MSAADVQQTGRWGVYPTAWAAFLAGPLAWCVNLEATYALTLHACAVEDRRVLHLTTLACLAVAILGSFLARAHWARLGGGVPADGGSGAHPAARFLSFLGLL